MDHRHQLYRERRRLLADRMLAQTGGGVAVVPTAPEAVRNRDSHYPYRHDSYFFYLTGFREPESVAVVQASDAGERHILFAREKDVDREIWDGFRYGPDAAREVFAFDEAHPIGRLEELLPDLLADRPALYTPLGMFAHWDATVTTTLNRVREKARAGVAAPETLVDVRSLLDEMRLVKDAHEIATMRRAAEISGLAHRRAMAGTRPGMFEYQVEAELLHEFLRHGAQHCAYPSIVASGPNACVLHYRENDRQLQDGELLLIDAGGEYQGYASDITRTFPVNGRFAPEQKAVYELVLAAQLACLEAIRPGRDFHDYHRVAERVISQGLIDLGLLGGSLDEVLEKRAFSRFYMHRAGHWLGLDVHDAGSYMVQGMSRKLEPGMVLTVEPGLYIRPGDDVPEAFWNIGIRIEDDVLVTGSGCENLTGATPKSVAEVEAAVGG
jgi:Xaa-Pro aminopeptidase